VERRDPTTAGWDELDVAEDGDLGADELLWACGTGSPHRGSRTRGGAGLQSRGTRNAAQRVECGTGSRSRETRRGSLGAIFSFLGP
jgi:hypothetical protein